MRFPTHKTKIVCTIGPACADQRTLERMIRRGMNVARLNLAHGDPDSHAQATRRLRAAAEKVGRRIAILADLPGPKIRVGELAQEPLELVRGQEIALTGRQVLGDARRISVGLTDLDKAVRPGETIFLNDGFIRLKVERVEEGEAHCRVVVGGPLRAHKGVNLPGADLGVGAVTQDDLRLLEFALEQGVDAVSVSFVQGPEDVEMVRQAIVAQGHAPFVIAKIERALAVQRFRPILEAADGIMVARGDLGVETPNEEIAILQKRLIHQANLLGKPEITATQMHESKTANTRPTRAEATDVANAVLDGTDAVMLSEESAVGTYPVEAVDMLARIARVAEAHGSGQPPRIVAPQKTRGRTTLAEAIAWDVAGAAERLHPRLILTPTLSGNTARRVARYRPDPWIVAFSPREATCQQLMFSCGVFPVRVERDRRDWKTAAASWCRQQGIAEGLAVMTQGASPGSVDGTNSLEVFSLTRSEAYERR